MTSHLTNFPRSCIQKYSGWFIASPPVGRHKPSNKTKGASFHKLPTGPQWKKLWLAKIKRVNSPRERTALCVLITSLRIAMREICRCVAKSVLRSLRFMILGAIFWWTWRPFVFLRSLFAMVLKTTVVYRLQIRMGFQRVESTISRIYHIETDTIAGKSTSKFILVPQIKREAWVRSKMLFRRLSLGLVSHCIEMNIAKVIKGANHKAAFSWSVIVIMSRLLLEIVNKYVLDILSAE